MRGVVFANHISNVSAYKKLLIDANGEVNSLFVMINQEPVYLFFDAVHLIKNVRNNLLAKKKFIFPPLSFNGFQEKIDVPGGEILWKTLNDVHDIDKSVSANLKKAPKLISKVCFLITNTRQLHISNIFEERQCDKQLNYFYGQYLCL